jgi:phosphoribosylformylglycinamidine synthase
LVRAAIACHDLAIQWKTPFISGKDSLNNEFSWFNANGEKNTIAIPCSLLISAMGQIDNCSDAVTMDFKRAGNSVYLIGVTRDEMAGSYAALALNKSGGTVPKVDAALAMRSYQAIHQAIKSKLIASCHDLSEGGLAVSLSEMAFAGELGVSVDITSLRQASFVDREVVLFSESNSRLLCEVPVSLSKQFESAMQGLPCFRIGQVATHDRVVLECDKEILIDKPWRELRNIWLAPLDWE